MASCYDNEVTFPHVAYTSEITSDIEYLMASDNSLYYSACLER